MPRRGESSRQQQAFLSLLDQQYAVSHGHTSDQKQHHKGDSRKHRKNSVERQLGGSGKISGFKLRDSADPAQSTPTAAARQIQAMFDHAWDIETIQQVLIGCNGSPEAATDYLLTLAASTASNNPNSAAQVSSRSSVSVGMQTAVSMQMRTSQPFVNIFCISRFRRGSQLLELPTRGVQGTCA